MEYQLRKTIPSEEFDYPTLMVALKNYGRPRDKVTHLLRKKLVIRVKKGIYVFGKDLARRPYSREILANLIYGPSYISLDTALNYHGLIPEKTEAVTSVTTGRHRRFSTPVGLFIYKKIPLAAYAIGVERKILLGNETQPTEGQLFCLMATPEKALADKMYVERGNKFRSQNELEKYLLDNLRISPTGLTSLNAEVLAEIAKRYHSQKILLISRLVERRQSKQGTI